jgi:hypothetical protein
MPQMKTVGESRLRLITTEDITDRPNPTPYGNALQEFDKLDDAVQNLTDSVREFCRKDKS